MGIESNKESLVYDGGEKIKVMCQNFTDMVRRMGLAGGTGVDSIDFSSKDKKNNDNIKTENIKKKSDTESVNIKKIITGWKEIKTYIEKKLDDIITKKEFTLKDRILMSQCAFELSLLARLHLSVDNDPKLPGDTTNAQLQKISTQIREYEKKISVSTNMIYSLSIYIDRQTTIDETDGIILVFDQCDDFKQKIQEYMKEKDGEQKKILFDRLYENYNILQEEHMLTEQVHRSKAIEIERIDRRKESTFTPDIQKKLGIDNTMKITSPNFTMQEIQDKLIQDKSQKFVTYSFGDNNKQIIIHYNDTQGSTDERGFQLGAYMQGQDFINIFLDNIIATHEKLKSIVDDPCDIDTLMNAIVYQELSHQLYNTNEAQSEIPSLQIAGPTFLTMRLPGIIDHIQNTKNPEHLTSKTGYDEMYSLYSQALLQHLTDDQKKQITENKDFRKTCTISGNPDNTAKQTYPFLYDPKLINNIITTYKELCQKEKDKHKHK